MRKKRISSDLRTEAVPSCTWIHSQMALRFSRTGPQSWRKEMASWRSRNLEKKGGGLKKGHGKKKQSVTLKLGQALVYQLRCKADCPILLSECSGLSPGSTPASSFLLMHTLGWGSGVGWQVLDKVDGTLPAIGETGINFPIPGLPSPASAVAGICILCCF